MLGVLCTQWVPETAPLDRKTSWFCFHTDAAGCCDVNKNTEFVGLLGFVKVKFHIHELSFTSHNGVRAFFGEVFLSSSSSSGFPSGCPSVGAEGLFYLNTTEQLDTSSTDMININLPRQLDHWHSTLNSS